MGWKMGAGCSTAGRGILSDIHHRIQCARFIPADAGNTAARWIEQIPGPVYPRWRGEHKPKHTINPNMSGLSPLARGTLW